jgi:hypothetical protein
VNRVPTFGPHTNPENMATVNGITISAASALRLCSWPLLPITCLAFRWLRERARASRRRVRTQGFCDRLFSCVDSAEIEFSGDALERRCWWVYVTATFDHGDWRHVIYNSLHLACVAPTLESRHGTASLWIGFVAFGAVRNPRSATSCAQPCDAH